MKELEKLEEELTVVDNEMDTNAASERVRSLKEMATLTQEYDVADDLAARRLRVRTAVRPNVKVELLDVYVLHPTAQFQSAGGCFVVAAVA